MDTSSLRIASESERITRVIAERIARHISNTKKKKGAYLILLKGDLGSGKTTFAKGLLGYFGIRPRAASPTFVIIKRYNIRTRNKKQGIRVDNVYHIDAYRLRSKKDLDVLGYKETLLDSRALVLIEWPEKVRGVERNADLVIFFEYGEKEHQRIITIKNPTKKRFVGQENKDLRVRR